MLAATSSTARTLLRASRSSALRCPARFVSSSSTNPSGTNGPGQPGNTQYTENNQTQGITGKFDAPKFNDVQNQPAKGAKKTKEKGSGSPLDAASAEAGQKQLKGRESRKKDGLSGNPEGVGFVEQVGSGSGTAEKFEGRK